MLSNTRNSQPRTVSGARGWRLGAHVARPFHAQNGDVIGEPAARLGEFPGAVNERVHERRTGQSRVRTSQCKQTVLPESLVACSAISLEEAVGKQQQSLPHRQFQLLLRPVVGIQAQRRAGRRLDPFHRPAGLSQHPRMTGPDRGDARAVGRDLKTEHRREDTGAGPFGVQYPLELAHQFGTPHAGECQCPPSDPQRRAQGRLVGPVPGDVPDQDMDDPVRRLHDVVEVATQQRVLATRPIPGDNLDTGFVQQQRGGQQAAFQQGVLAGPKLTRVQIRGDDLDPLALDRVKHCAAQHFGFDASLDQIILRPGRDRGSPEVLVVQTGQHHDRNRRVAFRDAVQSVHAVGVRQVQIQQYAVGPR